MREFNELMSSIENGNYSPFYLLSGVEPYFIDQIELKFKDQLVDEDNFGRASIFGRRQPYLDHWGLHGQFQLWPNAYDLSVLRIQRF